MEKYSISQCLCDLLRITPLYVELCFQKQYKLQPLTPPKQLLSELYKPQRRRKFIYLLNQKQTDGLHLLRKLTILHHCILHSPELCPYFMELDFKIQSKDAWLNEHVIYPYQQFLQKVTSGHEQYQQILPESVLEISFFKIFFVVSLLDHLFLTVNKISLLNRYYAKSLDNKNKSILHDFVSLCAFQAQFLYSSFSAILSEMLHYPQKYITTDDQVDLLKHLLKSQLSRINEEVKALFLHRDFHPLRYGYCIRLFRLQDQIPQIQNYAEKLYQSTYIKISKKHKKSALDQFLFDRKGRLNSSVYQTLQKYQRLDNTRSRSDTQQNLTESCEVVGQI